MLPGFLRAARFTDPGFDKDVWKQMCEMGWPGLLVSEDLGGSGLSHACVVRTAKIAVLDAQLAVRIGVLASADRAKVRQNLRDLLRVVLPA